MRHEIKAVRLDETTYEIDPKGYLLVFKGSDDFRDGYVQLDVRYYNDDGESAAAMLINKFDLFQLGELMRFKEDSDETEANKACEEATG